MSEFSSLASLASLPFYFTSLSFLSSPFPSIPPPRRPFSCFTSFLFHLSSLLLLPFPFHSLSSQTFLLLILVNFLRPFLEGADEPNTCYTWGQAHYKTFDGKYFYFPGHCSYQLVADCSENTFSIHVTKDPLCLTSSSCRRAVELYLGGFQVKVK